MVRKFTASGQEVEVFQKLDDGRYLVARIYEGSSWGHDDEFIADKEEIVSQLFDETPTEKLDAGIAKLNQEVEALIDRKRDVIQELKEAETTHKERMAKYASYGGLQHLDNYIAGRITHYVTDIRWTPEIKKSEEMFGDFHGEGPRLLSLFGNSEGQLDWRINRYKDDSGSWNECIPCLSYEEAVKKLEEVALEEMEDNFSATYIKLFDEHGISLPDGYREKTEQKRVQSLVSAVDKARQKLAELEAQL